MTDTEPHILIVDDDRLQISAFRFEIERHGLHCPVHDVKNGDDGLAMLGRRENPLPAQTIILVDLDIPNRGGFDFVENLRRDPTRRRTVVFAISSCDDPAEIARLYDLGIAGYVQKSTLAPSRLELIRMLLDYVHVVTLPAA